MLDDSPPPYSAYEPGSFAHFTLLERFPKILADVRKELGEEPAADPCWHALLDDVIQGGPIAPDLIAPITDFWRDWRARHVGACWRDLGFMELEFLFYHAINGIAAAHSPDHDVFQTIRHSALQACLPEIGIALEANEHRGLAWALDLALFGNRADLSQLHDAASIGLTDHLLVDDRAALIDTAKTAKEVHLIVDNAGEELCCDLLLACALLEAGGVRVVVHAKPWPMFVSDALPSDVAATIKAFVDSGSPELGRRGAMLTEARQAGKLVIETAPDWGEPRSLGQLSPVLTTRLAAADLVILKGDLNYRRCFGDRSWPASTPVAQATNVPFASVFALRVLKSDTLVGVERERVNELDANSRNWRTDGRFAMVQRVDGRGVDESARDGELSAAGRAI